MKQKEFNQRNWWPVDWKSWEVKQQTVRWPGTSHFRKSLPSQSIETKDWGYRRPGVSWGLWAEARTKVDLWRWEPEVQKRHHLSKRQIRTLTSLSRQHLPLAKPRSKPGDTGIWEMQPMGVRSLRFTTEQGKDTEWVCNPYKKSPCTLADGDIYNKTYSSAVHNTKTGETSVY